MGIQRGRRFVQKPKRAFGQQQPDKPEPPFLAGREIAGGHGCQIVETEALKRRCHGFPCSGP